MGTMSHAARIGLAALPAMVLASAATAQTAPVAGKTYKVGYSQIVDHPALNATRQGFQDALKAAGFIEGKNLVFEYQNAQGNPNNVRDIAEKFVADGVDILAPCTTPDVQATVKVARGGPIPVIFGCITNPVTAGITDSLDKPTGTNITGMYNLQPAAEVIDLISELMPGAKTVGILYNGGESNSVSTVALARAEAVKRGLKPVEVQVTSSAEVKSAADSFAGRVDVIFTPQDNTVASAFDAVLKSARDSKLPLFSTDTSTVQRGAVASFGVDQYQEGVAWAKQVAIPVLLGQSAATLTPVSYKDYQLYVNSSAAAAAHVTIPPAVLSRAVKVYTQ
jgi:putative tryptophan/tyrosine transport system substrate-binding protein